jgi:galactokinase
MHETVGKLIEKFASTFGSKDGLRCARAPGRVNLIGEHTDYNGGFVLPMAIDRDVRVFFRHADRGPARVWSENYGEWDEFDLDRIQHNPRQPWSNYVRGVAWALHEAGLPVRPIEAIIYGNVPIGAGLSSSAAIEVACALAFCPEALKRPGRRELALICQRAENRFVGVNCGIMDQFVSLHAEDDRAVLIDCRSLDYKLLPLDTSRVRVMVCNTMVHHELGSSAYNERRSTCELASRQLNDRLGDVRQLRDVTSVQLADHADALDELTYRRARHVVTEDERALAAVAALTEGRYEEFGALMNASHESLREDYEVSCRELDLMVEIARRQPGTLGARMTGAGFGGCTVNLVRREAAAAFAPAVAEAYESETGIRPEVYEFSAVPGAQVVNC